MPVSISGAGTINDLPLPTDSFEPGLVHVYTNEFSSVSSLSVNNVFTAEYDNYRIFLHPSSTSSNANLSMRLRSSGTDSSGSNYFRGGYYINIGGTLASNSDNSATQFNMGSVSTDYGDQGAWIFDLISPALTKRTMGSLDFSTTVTNTIWYMQHYGIGHNLQQAYDGFTITSTAGSFSGIIRVYGYRNDS